jgi:hypothetical protein
MSKQINELIDGGREADNTMIHLLYERCIIHLISKDINKAIVDLERAISIYKNDYEKLLPHILKTFQLHLVLMAKKKDKEKMLLDFDVLEKIDKNFPSVKFDYNRAYIQFSNFFSYNKKPFLDDLKFLKILKDEKDVTFMRSGYFEFPIMVKKKKHLKKKKRKKYKAQMLEKNKLGIKFLAYYLNSNSSWIGNGIGSIFSTLNLKNKITPKKNIFSFEKNVEKQIIEKL